MDKQDNLDKNLKELFQTAMDGTEVDSSMKKQVFDAIDVIKFFGDLTNVYSSSFGDSQIRMLETLNSKKKDNA
ncbi:MAG: hypothetical protein KTR13_07595 [Saprospiraceae bacterium]|nr:hypothetical protein [Saprospiraceae bacterium]